MIKSSKQNGAIASGLLANRNATDSGLAISDPSIESFENAYAEASQARTLGKRPIPLGHYAPEEAKELQSHNIGRETASASDTAQLTEPSERHEHSAHIQFDVAGDRRKKSDADILPRMMTVGDLATYLSMSPSKIWRLCKREPTFPQPIRIAGSTRWDRTAIDLYLDGLQYSKSSGH